MELYLIRHTRPTCPEGLCYGQSEVPVDAAEVCAAAARLRPLLPPAPVFSSPLGRCRQLARELATSPTFDARLMEMHFGSWELQAWRDIAWEEIEAWRRDLLGFAPPGGESAGSLLTRAVQFVRELQRCEEPAAIIVAHAGVLRAVTGYVLGLPVAEWSALPFDFGSLSKIEAGTGATLVWHNR